MLVYESMLASVITARDKWLKPVSISHLLMSCPVNMLVLYDRYLSFFSVNEYSAAVTSLVAFNALMLSLIHI